MTTRNPVDLQWEQAFAAEFGQDQADAIRKAAEEHKNGLHDNDNGNPFRWAVLICIGHECMERFREHHGITAPFLAIKKWFVERDALRDYQGDVDYLALFEGVYNEWMKQEAQP